MSDRPEANRVSNAAAAGRPVVQAVDPQSVFAEADKSIPIGFAPFGDLTHTDEIRAVFGLSEAELPDEMLTQRVYTREAEAALYALSPRLFGEWLPLSSANPALRGMVEVYVLYCIADKLCDILPLIAARTLSDSKATFQRFDNDLKAVIDHIRRRFAQAAKALADLMEKTAVRTTAPRFSGVRPRIDRVTGESY
ncbi:hypothetical protein V9W64_10860 [Neisseria leonii]|uniref:Uncharacterized protein n=1 Tax=Neisseria leonii TaxID=2995413 RepID=A0A9X4ID23_9NEIS|nr:hypothetical protein [Neisseria sp. 51.81]MDD9326742.1 hypothetical protein [Neisseria sp. 51.81]